MLSALLSQGDLFPASRDHDLIAESVKRFSSSSTDAGNEDCVFG
jgi:hypothetical protein